MARSRWLLLIGAVACGALAQGVAAWGTSAGSLLAAVGLFAVGGGLLARLDASRPDRLRFDPATSSFAEPPCASVALLLVAFAAAVAATLHTGETFAAWQIAAYGLSIATLIAFAALADRAARKSRGAEAAGDLGLSLLDLGLLGLLTTVAFFFRLWQLDSLPALLWDDEILYLFDALRLLEDGKLSPFASGEWGAPYLHAYSIAGAASLVADRIVALRLVSAIPGALAVPFLYLAMRQLFDRKHAFFAAFLLAVSVWHTILSRQGYVWAINGFVESIALWGLARGLRRGRFTDFAIAGFALGLGFAYTYAAALMPLALALFVGVLRWRAPQLWQARRAGLLFFGLSSMVVVAPRLAALVANPDMRGYQLQALAVGEESAPSMVARQLGEMAQSFNRRADNNELFVPAPNEPLLDPVTACAFGLGFFWAVFSFRRLGAAVLLLTFAVMLLPPAFGVSSTEWATAWRACGVVPALFGLAGAPGAIAAGVPRTRSGRVFMGGLLAALVILVTFVNAHTYFARHASKPRWFYGHNAVHMAAARRLLAAPPGTRVLVNYDLAFGQLRALAWGRRAYEVFTWPDEDLLPHLLAGEAHPVLVLGAAQLLWEDDIAAGTVLLDFVRHYFPSGRGEVVRGSDGSPLLASFELSEEEIRTAQGRSQRPPPWGFVERVTCDGKVRSERWVPLLWYAAERELDFGKDCDVEWSGDVRVPRDGRYTLMLMSARPTSIEIDGTTVASQQSSGPVWLRLPIDLTAGWHRLRVTGQAPVTRRDLRLFWIDDENRPSLLGGVASSLSRSPESGS